MFFIFIEFLSEPLRRHIIDFCFGSLFLLVLSRDMVDLFSALKAGTGLFEVKWHFVFHTLAHGIHHPGIITEPGFIAGFTAADNLVDLFPVFFKKAFNIDRSQHRLVDDGFMADGKLQKYGKPLICHVLVFAGAADVHVRIAFSPVFRKIRMKPLRSFCDKEEIKISAGPHHGPGIFPPFVRIRMEEVRGEAGVDHTVFRFYLVLAFPVFSDGEIKGFGFRDNGGVLAEFRVPAVK